MNLYSPHEVRVIDEKFYLDEKVGKLAAFINNPESGFQMLHEIDKDLLTEQLKAMKKYSSALLRRIARFVPRKEALSLRVFDMDSLASERASRGEAE